MTNLRKDARGQNCKVREPRACNGNWETTVLAHWRQMGISGLGLKAPDLLAAHACGGCHDFIDGRSHPEATRSEREIAHLRGIMRTQMYWIEMGVVAW